MIIENTQVEPKQETDERILNFLDYIVLMLSQANTVDELDLIMDDFSSNDILLIMEEHKQLFGVLSVICLDTFERICVKDDENNFSLKTLHLPIIFKRMGWKIESEARLADLHQISLKRSEESTILYPNLVLLFIEGLILPTNQALNNFEERVEGLLNSEEDESNINQLITDIASIGWR
ncbi:MAG: hypothetical protein OEM38_05240 [Gammaproteobacteria bacterium]|nr:hypothetical protein [Gammaproteobacteria bacterium]